MAAAASEKDKLVYKAKLSEETERYDDMVSTLFDLESLL